MKKKKSVGEWIFTVCNLAFMGILIIITLYPIYYVLIASISDPVLLMSHQGPLYTVLGEPTLVGYEKTFENRNLLVGFGNTLFYLIAGTALQLVLTCFAAYVLTRKTFLIRGIMMKMMIFTMFFSGGLIPLFFVIKETHIYDTIWVSSVPYAISTFNVIIMMTFFRSIPSSLEEAAIIDGANDFKVFAKIILPLSKPVLAVITLYYGVGQWNSWFPATMFARDRDLMPLQVFLREIIIENSTTSADNIIDMVENTFASELVKYCTIVVSTVPILIVYPFLQKYFEKGVMIGAVKG